jgi:formate dehydrogenase alpha subunit
MEKRRVFSGSAPVVVSTICPFCGCGCTIDLEVKGNRIVRARPGENGAVNHGTLCVKGSFGHDFVHSPERLTRPLIKVNGEFEAASWEQALGTVASELNRMKEAHGPNSLAVLSSSKCTNEENYLLQRFVRSVLGTNNVDNGSRLYSAANIVGLGSPVGFPGTTNHLDALEHSEVILVTEVNLASAAPIVEYAVKRAVRYRGAKLLLVDPLQTGLSSFADVWLRPKVGTDIALTNGMARVIVTEDLLDEEFVSRKTDNFEALSDSLRDYTAEHVEEITGVPAEDLRRAARLFAGANVASIVYGGGITQHVTGTNSVTALANLAMLTGNIGLRGGIFALQRDCNGQGACDMGALPNLLPGYEGVEDTGAKKKFADRWGADLPAEAGLTAVEMIEHAKEGKVKGMYIVGENPALSFPHPTLVKEALESLDFLVVQDMFLTDTAKLANVVLPAASFAEKEGTFTNFEGRVQRLHRVIEPIGDSLPDSEIVLRLAQTMGQPMPYSSIQQVADEIAELVPLFQRPGDGDSDMKDVYHAELDRDPLGKRRLHKGQFPKGFGRFSPVEYEPQPEIPQDGYNYTLLSGGVLHHSGTGSKTSRSPRLSGFSPEAYVEINESDANRIGVSEGDQVKVISPTGEVTAAARFSTALPEGMVFMPNCFPSTPVNELFGIALDPQTMTPALKTCAVRLERT